MRIRIQILDPYWKKWIRIQEAKMWRIHRIQVMNINFQIFLVFANKFSYFFHLFLCNNLINHPEIRTFLIIFAVLVDILRLDPHIFADPDPGSQNVADPMNFSNKIYKTMLNNFTEVFFYLVLINVQMTRIHGEKVDVKLGEIG